MSKSPGKETPKFIQVLLSADEDSAEFAEAAEQLERHPQRHTLLEQVAFGPDDSWQEIRETLATSGLPTEGERNSKSSPSPTVFFEIQGQDSSRNAVDASDGSDGDAGSELPTDEGHGQSDPENEAAQVVLDFLDPPTHPELLGRFGRYEVERVIGVGGMGVVLRAFDSDLHRVVAIKVLAPHLAHSSTARRRFAREAQAAAAVVHPNVIQIHDVDTDNKAPHLVMQYVPGDSLQLRVDRQGGLSVPETLRVGLQAAAALDAAHSQGLVHRDVKPANILLEEKVGRVVLTDFGLARTADDASLTRTGIVAGTPHYMSPEQASGNKIDRRSDLFSLGSVLYFMLTGQPPFRAEGAMAVLNKICRDEVPDIQDRNPEVPREVAELVQRCLAKDPEDRMQSAGQLQIELQRLLTAYQAGHLSFESSRTLDSGDKQESKTLSARNKWLIVGAAVLATWLGITAWPTLWRNDNPENSSTQANRQETNGQAGPGTNAVAGNDDGNGSGGQSMSAAQYFELERDYAEMQERTQSIEQTIQQMLMEEEVYSGTDNRFDLEMQRIQWELQRLNSELEGPESDE